MRHSYAGGDIATDVFPIDESWVKIKNRTVGISSVTAVHYLAPKITTLHIKQRGNPGKFRNLLLSLFYNCFFRSRLRNERLETKSYLSGHFHKSGSHLVELDSSGSHSKRIG